MLFHHMIWTSENDICGEDLSAVFGQVLCEVDLLSL
jgi:hypothetical protein